MVLEKGGVGTIAFLLKRGIVIFLGGESYINILIENFSPSLGLFCKCLFRERREFCVTQT